MCCCHVVNILRFSSDQACCYSIHLYCSTLSTSLVLWSPMSVSRWVGFHMQLLLSHKEYVNALFSGVWMQLETSNSQEFGLRQIFEICVCPSFNAHILQLDFHLLCRCILACFVCLHYCGVICIDYVHAYIMFLLIALWL